MPNQERSSLFKHQTMVASFHPRAKNRSDHFAANLCLHFSSSTIAKSFLGCGWVGKQHSGSNLEPKWPHPSCHSTCPAEKLRFSFTTMVASFHPRAKNRSDHFAAAENLCLHFSSSTIAKSFLIAWRDGDAFQTCNSRRVGSEGKVRSPIRPTTFRMPAHHR